MEKVTITCTEFNKYRFVQDSGVTNMFDTARVSQLSGLERETVREIIRNYDVYIERFEGGEGVA